MAIKKSKKAKKVLKKISKPQKKTQNTKKAKSVKPTKNKPVLKNAKVAKAQLQFDFTPIADRILVRQSSAEQKTGGGIIIPHAAQEKPKQGEVLKVGPGKLNKKGVLKALDVKAGDFVLFSAYAGVPLKLNGDELIILNEKEILGKLE